MDFYLLPVSFLQQKQKACSQLYCILCNTNCGYLVLFLLLFFFFVINVAKFNAYHTVAVFE